VNEEQFTNSEATFGLTRMKDFIKFAIRSIIHFHSNAACSYTEKELIKGRHSAIIPQQYAGGIWLPYNLPIGCGGGNKHTLFQKNIAFGFALLNILRHSI
jgi:hypothetical protein